MFCSLVSLSQTVKVNGTVIDNYDKRPLSGISVINQRLNTSVMVGSQGNFSVTMDKQDTMFLFFPGYQTLRFCMKDSGDQTVYTPTFYMNRLQTGSSTAVIVTPKKDLTDIEKERKNLGKYPELNTPRADFLSSPISAIYELVSHRAQEREKLRKMMTDDARRKVFFELFDYYREAGIMDLPKENYNDFVNYCHLNLDFLRLNSDYEITKTVLMYYSKYARLNGLVK